jgi:hypothetical protein
MTTSFSETDEDNKNVEAWAEVVADLLRHVPPDKRDEVLALATKNEEVKAQEREEANGGLALSMFSDDWMNEPGQRHCNAIMRLKSLLVQVFVRDIKTNYSPQDATKILFAKHPHGYGSRRLQDYLPTREKQ